MSAEPSPLPPPALERGQRIALIAGAVGLLVCLVAGFLGDYRTQAFRSYLFAFNLFVGLGLGSLAIVMISHLTGGSWSFFLRRPLEASTRTLPVLALLFLPLLLGLSNLYPWANPDVVKADTHLQHKAAYLNVGFFIVRAVIYFAVWIGLTLLLNWWSRRQEGSQEARSTAALQTMSGPGLVLLVLTVTFAAIDWLMSLEPEWYSTIYGAMIGWGHVLSAYAFSLGALLLLAEYPPLRGAIPRSTLGDLGSLLLAFIMVWAYLSLMQYLLIWSGNLPEEAPWYLYRTSGGWQVIGILLMLVHFALPFVLLLSHDYRRDPRILFLVVGIILVMRVLNLFWLIVPGYRPHQGLNVHLLDLAALVGVGGIWLGVFLWQVRQRPLLPPHRPAENNHHG